MTCAADVTVSNDAASCDAAVVVPAPTATADNCVVATVINDYNGTASANDTYPVGTTTITWTVTDVNGNTNTCTQDVIVNDTEAPTITCAANVTVSNDIGSCDAAVVVPVPTATADNCGVATVLNDYNGTASANDTYPVGTTTVTWEVTDLSGNTQFCTQDVIVNDTEAPTITCAANVAVNNDPGSCDAAVVVPAPTATADNCAVATVINDYNGTASANDTYPVGTTTITWTVTDVNGNTNTCTQDVTVTDNEAPTITCAANVTVSNDATSCDAAVVVPAPTATADNCVVATVINDYNGTASANDTYPVGTTTITWTVTDVNGNTNTCTQDVIVNDTEAPTITCAANVTVSNDIGSCDAAVVVPVPTATADNCGVATVLNDYNGTASANDTYPVGTTTVTWEVTDLSGNTQFCTQDVIVNDTEAPTITCAANVAVNNDPGSCDAAVVVPAPTATADNCAVATVINDYNGTASANDTYPVGTTTITWTVTDVNGNTNTCTQDVTVTDNEAPTITCAANVTVSNDATSCDAAVVVPAPTATADNCGVATVLNDYNGTASANDTYPVGTTTVTWEVTDLSGNTQFCTQDVIVNDTEAPTITCAANVAVNNDPGSCDAAVVVPAPTATADNCAVATVINDYNGTASANDTYPVGTTTITWTVTDVNGNTNTCTQDVTVTDNEAPTITCAADVTVSNDAASCDAAVVVPAPTATADNCVVATVINDYNGTASANDTYPVGTTTITWTVTDVNGNTNTCTQDVIVNDTEAPTITCAANVTVSNDIGSCDAAVVVPVPTATADNCGVATVLNDYNGTASANDTYPVGTTTVTWEVTDLSGNTQFCTQDVIVNDTEAPTITCAANVAVNNDPGSCDAAVVVPAPTATADNCAVATVINDYNGTASANDTYPVGTTTVTWEVTDLSGNTQFCTQDVIVNDTEAPTITCAANVAVNNDPGSCDAAVVVPAPTATADNCAVATVINDYNGTASANDTYPVGTTTITWTVTDVNGNTNTCTQDVTVTDNEAPTITCAANVTVSNDAASCDAAVVVPAPTATADNCAVATVINDYNGTASANDTYPVGTTTVTWTVTDVNGNTNTCTQDVIVNDTEAPTITCAANVTVSNDIGSCDAAVVVPVPTATADNCGVASVLNDYNGTASANDTYPVGTTTVTWEVTDLSGNTQFCTQDVIVNDTEAPTITCAANVAVNNDPGSCDAAVVVPAPTATADNCAVATVINDYNGTASANDTYPVGTTTVTWTVTDVNGNTNTCTQDVTVTDNEAPTITCAADVTVSNDATSCDAAVVVPAPTATADNCAVATVINDYNGTASANDTYPVGTTTVTWTVTDVNGNTNTCTQDVIVNDTEAPTITCAANVTVSNDIGSCDAAVVVPVPTATADNCGVASVLNDYNGTASANDTYPVGTTTVTWEVTDLSGNTQFCTQDVIVNDTEAPTITCAANVAVNNDPGSCDAAVVVPAPTATADNCAVATVINDYNGTASANDTYPVGTTTVTWTVTDVNGNTNTCTQDVIVNDTEAPTITCAANVTVSNDIGSCDAAVVVPVPTATADNCAVATVINDYNGTASANDTYPVGTTTVTWTVTDVNGNTNTCTQDVIVNDTEAPTITCAANVTVSNDIGSCDAAVVVPVPTATADNCGVATVLNDYNGTASANDTYPVGTTTVTWEVTDLSGNTQFCTQDVIVNDTEAPTITCAANVAVNNDPGSCDAAVVVPAPTATADNCAVATVINDYNGTASANDTYPVGTTTITWTVTDVNGNTNTCTQDVTVTDNEAPTITCAANVTVSNDAASCDAAVVVPAPTATADNCAVATVINDYNGTASANDTYPVGTTTVTWTVTDVNGNTNTCTQDVTVTDNEAPTIACPANITVNTDPGLCGATVTYTTPVGADNCPGAITSMTAGQASGTVFPVGTTTVTYQVVDVSGNNTSCSFDVTVNDNEAPSINTCPVNVNINNDPGVCTATLDPADPVVSDNCAITLITWSLTGATTGTSPGTGLNLLGSTTFNNGTTTITYNIEDAAGNTSVCTFDIIVSDNENPTISCPANITVNSDPGVCGATVTYTAPVGADNCPGSVTAMTAGQASGTIFPIGTTTVTYQVTDASGNTAQCSFDVTVNDNEAPTISCPADINVNNDLGSCGAIVTYTIPVGADNCPGSATAMTAGQASGTLFLLDYLHCYLSGYGCFG
ncbi:HYR domain-containing protein [Paracrocinitomix mangrovi]|uniref:HYR domain-containing protein n=1 Tax=Paracrocinitomix mangrovi TaxID=2862509 RepID=UPI001EDB126E|nr:HYR domain-containing protein [Paracrocinitomix mangrovi]UKN03856.1 HYR domain-containing protein [Paracrocinitomix mangrovi]